MMTESNSYCESGECKSCICLNCNTECSNCPRMWDIGTTVEKCEFFKRRGSMSNADRIRRMTDEQMAEWWGPNMLCRMCPKEVKIAGCDEIECKRQALIWLKQESYDE